MKPLRTNAEIVSRSADQIQQLHDDGQALFLFRRIPGSIAMDSKATGIPINRILAVRRDPICGSLVHKFKVFRCQETGEITQYYGSYPPDEQLKEERTRET